MDDACLPGKKSDLIQKWNQQFDSRVGWNICSLVWRFSQQPVQPQYYYGPNFGYIVAFKPSDSNEWRKVTLADPQGNRYVHKDASLPPSTEFQVKVKAFNSEGEGPFSLTAIIYSAQDGEHRRVPRLPTLKKGKMYWNDVKTMWRFRLVLRLRSSLICQQSAISACHG